MNIKENNFYMIRSGSVVYINYKFSEKQITYWSGFVVKNKGFSITSCNWTYEGLYLNPDQKCWDNLGNYLCSNGTHEYDIVKQISDTTLQILTEGPLDISSFVWREILITRIINSYMNIFFWKK